MRRKPSTLERVLGRRRTRVLRRRLGLVALGAGAGLLAPTIRRAALTGVAIAVLVVSLNAWYR